MKNLKNTLVRDNMGRFAPKLNIVNGRLYSLDNEVTVRAEAKCNNGLFMVRYHKDLYGIVKSNRLSKIDKKKVNKYLKNT